MYRNVEKLFKTYHINIDFNLISILLSFRFELLKPICLENKQKT